MQSYKKLLISSVLEYGFNVRNFIYNEIGIVENDETGDLVTSGYWLKEFQMPPNTFLSLESRFFGTN